MPNPRTGENDTYYFATFSSDKDVIFDEEGMFLVQTVYADDEMLIPLDLEESYATVTDDEISNSDEGVVYGFYVPANTGVMLMSFDGEDATYYFVDNDAEDNYLAEIASEDNMLQPASKDKDELPNHKFYKLAYSDSSHAPETLGFYWGAENGGAFTSKAGLAYLAVPTGEGNESLAPKGFRFVDSGATAIKSVENKGKINVVYNLAGQRVSTKSFKGIVIKNGKKILNK